MASYNPYPNISADEMSSRPVENLDTISVTKKVAAFGHEHLLFPSLILLVLSWTTVVVYRLYFHPLAKFPGPKIAAATQLYEEYYDALKGGQYMFKIAELHRKYGPIIRISPSELHIYDPKYHGELFNRHGPWDKHPLAYKPLGANSGNWHSALMTMKHDVHRRRRASMNPFFSKPAISDKLHLVIDNLLELRRSIDEYAADGEIMNIGAAFTAFSSDVSCDLFLGQRMQFLNGKQISEYLLQNGIFVQRIFQLLKHSTVVLVLYIACLVVMGLLRMLPASLKGTIDDFLKQRKMTEELRDAAMADQPDSSRETLVGVIARCQQLADSDKGVERVFAEISVVLGAAMDTVAHTLRILIFWIYSKPEILQRLRQELKQNCLDDDQFDLARLEQLPYLTAVITEGLRFNPGVTSRLARVAPDRDLVYKDWVIPAGHPVSMSNYLMHMDESIYPRPEVFDPERWVDPEDRRRLDYAFAPFSKGTRNCIGIHLARAQLYLVLAMVVMRYDFVFAGTKASDVECGADQFTPSSKTKNGVKVFATRVDT